MSESMAKREATGELLAELSGGRSRVTIAEAVAASQERGISRRTLSRIGAQMGIKTIHCGRGHGGIWERVLP